MTELLTAAQMRAIEEAAIASDEVTGLELMERAGRGVVAAIFEEWPELAPSWGPAPKPPEYLLQDDEKGLHRAVVLCGPGNNGGDGFVVARLLKECGWEVEVFLYGEPEKLPPDARVNYERWGELGRISKLDDKSFDRGLNAEDAPNLFVDALFGTGLTRPVPSLPNLKLVLETAHSRWLGRRTGSRIVAIDFQSGLCADSGRWLSSDALDDFPRSPHLTVTFHRPKLGHYLSDGFLTGCKVSVCDIGIPSNWRATRAIAWKDVVTTTELSEEIDRWQVAKSSGHKYSHGHALILSGGVGKGGAARLAARGALRIGAGAVTVGCPPAALIENAAQVNAVMLQRMADAAGLAAALEDARISALCLGPGMGTGAREAEMVETALQASRPGLDPGPRGGGGGPGSSPGRGIVLDADALTLLARDQALFAKLHKNCVLTPHAGEFARLFPDIAEKLNAPATKGPAYSKVDATREAAKRAGCVVLFKGPDTVIADPSGWCSINASIYERAAPWLATAGSGDVLAGFITGLLARGFGPMRAAETGAWLHTECALSFGPGLIAEDLPEELPKVLRNLGL